MYKRIDQQNKSDEIEGFVYESGDYALEGVLLGEDNKLVTIGHPDAAGTDKFVIYVADIPKLILALEAAHKYLVKG